LDLKLPDAEGLDTVVNVRAHAPHIPLIVLTGLDDEAAGAAAVDAGAQDYLVKGQVDGGQLARAIRYAIGRRQADDAQQQLRLAECAAARDPRAGERFGEQILDEQRIAVVVLDQQHPDRVVCQRRTPAV
jgi:DNA-binding response OmpR family regulator